MQPIIKIIEDQYGIEQEKTSGDDQKHCAKTTTNLFFVKVFRTTTK
jgi:hypothetical protein